MHAAPLLSLTLLSAAALTGCNSDEIVAQRLDRSISIDGDPSEWGELIVEVDDLDDSHRGGHGFGSTGR